MLKLKFTYNQIGLALDYFQDGEWRGAGLWSHEKIKSFGGLQNTKSKILMGITQPYKLVNGE